MTDLPYTYTDPDDDSIAVGVDHLVTTSGTVRTPTGADAAAFARAVLAAAGDTGHIVVSNAEMARWVYENRDECIRSMRERAAEVADQPAEWSRLETPAERIRALPLLPDGDTTPVYESDVESRLSALESLASDQADALEAQSQLIDTLRTKSQEAKAAGIPTRPYNAWTDG